MENWQKSHYHFFGQNYNYTIHILLSKWAFFNNNVSVPLYTITKLKKKP